MHSVEGSSVNQSMILGVARVTRCTTVDEALPASMIDAEERRGAGCDGKTEDEEREFHEMDGFGVMRTRILNAAAVAAARCLERDAPWSSSPPTLPAQLLQHSTSTSEHRCRS